MEHSQLQLEAALIGAVVRNRDVFDGLQMVRPEDFVDSRHCGIWKQIVELTGHSRLTVWDAQILASEGRLDADYLLTLEMSAPRGREKPEEYARIIAERGHERRVRSAAEAISRAPVQGEALMRMVENFIQIAHGTTTGGPRRLSEGVSAWLQSKERMVNEGDSAFVEFGFPGLDHRIGGLRPGELLIVAGRPATGKTQFALDVARYVARQKRAVHICNLEMLEEQMLDRMVSSVGEGIDLARLRSPHREPDKAESLFEQMINSVGEIQGLPIWVDYTSDDLYEISSHVRRMKRLEDTQLLIVDYLQLVGADGRSRAEEVGTISRGLKRLGSALGIPVIALAQMNRDVEKRQGGRPVLADLRESGSIEQDADFVVFLWRHVQSFMSQSGFVNEATLNVVEAITAKARQGKPGTDYLRAQFDFSRFGNLTPQEIEAYVACITSGMGSKSEDRASGFN